jgi:phosphohistidine phosphatase SixA
VRVYVVRHGDAGDSIPDDPKADAARPLTPGGQEMVKALAVHLLERGTEPTEIWASGYARARQTAKILAAAYPKAKMRIDPGLDEGKSIRGVVRRISADEKKKRIMVVSHHSSIHHGLQSLNFQEGESTDDLMPFAMSELRELNVDRDTGFWEEEHRWLPSDAGLEDIYQ